MELPTPTLGIVIGDGFVNVAGAPGAERTTWIVKVTVPRLVAPSCNCRIRSCTAPHVAFTVKAKSLAAFPPISDRAIVLSDHWCNNAWARIAEWPRG